MQALHVGVKYSPTPKFGVEALSETDGRVELETEFDVAELRDFSTMRQKIVETHPALAPILNWFQVERLLDDLRKNAVVEMESPSRSLGKGGGAAEGPSAAALDALPSAAATVAPTDAPTAAPTDGAAGDLEEPRGAGSESGSAHTDEVDGNGSPRQLSARKEIPVDSISLDAYDSPSFEDGSDSDDLVEIAEEVMDSLDESLENSFSDGGGDSDSDGEDDWV